MAANEAPPTNRLAVPRLTQAVRTILALLAGALMAAALPGARAAALDTTSPVVIVRSTDAAPYAAAAEAIRQKLATPERPVAVVDLNALTDSDEAGYKALIAAGKSSLFVAIGSQAAEWLHGRLPPAVMLIYCMVADPESRGLLKGRVSFGISTTIPWVRQCALIREAIKPVRRIGLLYAKNDPASKAAMEALRKELSADLELVAVAVDDTDSVADAIQTLLNSKPDVVWTSADSAVYNSATVRSLLLQALRRKIPIFGFSTPFVHAGALFGVGIDPADQGAQCSELCEAYLAAVKADALAEFLKKDRIVAPRFQVAVNLIVARQLEHPLPEELKTKADVVYKDE